jgi:hypothetical protein
MFFSFDLEIFSTLLKKESEYVKAKRKTRDRKEGI